MKKWLAKLLCRSVYEENQILKRTIRDLEYIISDTIAYNESVCNYTEQTLSNILTIAEDWYGNT